MREGQDEEKEEFPSAVDEAASVISESKRKEALVRKNRSVKEKPVRGLIISVTAILVLLVLSVILMHSLGRQKRTALGAAILSS